MMEKETEMNILRRSVLAASALAAGLLALGGLQSAMAQEKVLRVMTYGSTWEKVLKPKAAEFLKKTGYKIEPVIQNSSSEGLAKIQASRAKPGVDIWFTGEAIAHRAATDKDLFLDIPVDKIPNLKKVMPGTVQKKFVPFWYFPTGIVYRTDLVPGGKVTSWQELFTPPFKNKISLPAPTVYAGRIVLLASLLNGGSIDNIKPGIEFLHKNRNQVAMFHSADSAARKALASGEIIAMFGSPSAAKEMLDKGIPAAMVSPKPTPITIEGMMIVNNGDINAAAEFINWSLSDEIQKFMTDVYNLAPVNVDVEPAAELKAILPSKENAVRFDEAKINQNLGAWTEEFNAAVAK